MAKEKKLVEAITSMDEDFAQWYTDVVKKAELIDYTSVKGCMAIKPAGYAIWENIQHELDRRFKETGVQNVYMPMLIPESLLQKEKDHVEGFAPEVAWVTHGGLEPLQERMCVRPTSETLFCDFYSRDIHSYRDLRVYLTVDSQQTLDCAASAKARYVELLFTQVQVEPVPYSSGYFTVDVTFYYRVIADATLSAGRTNTVTGLAVFSKRLVLFGGETSARIFSSRDDLTCLCKKSLQSVSLPRAIAETVDPIILGSRVMEACSCCCQNEASPAIPEALLGCFDEPLVLTGECKRLLVTIGQFSIVRLERDTQLLIPTFDYCVPSKTCPPVGGTSTESPCEVFSQIDFPMDAFFPGKNEPCIKPEDSCTGCSRTK